MHFSMTRARLPTKIKQRWWFRGLFSIVSQQKFPSRRKHESVKNIQRNGCTVDGTDLYVEVFAIETRLCEANENRDHSEWNWWNFDGEVIGSNAGKGCWMIADKAPVHSPRYRNTHPQALSYAHLTFCMEHSHFHSSGWVTTTLLLCGGNFDWRHVLLGRSRASLSRVLVSAIRGRTPHQVAGCHLRNSVATRYTHIYIHNVSSNTSRIRITLSHASRVR